MATVTSLGVSGNSMSPTRAVEVGEFIVVGCFARAEITACADNSTQGGAANSYTRDKIQADSSAADGFSAIFSCRVTRRILATDAISITFSPGGFNAMAVAALDPIASSLPFDQSAGVADSDFGSTWDSSSTGTTAQADEIAIGVAGQWGSTNDPTNPVPDAPWAEVEQRVDPGSGFDMGYRILAAPGAYNFTGSWGVAMNNDGSAIIATYKIGAAPPAGDPVDRRMIRTSRGTSW